MRIAFAPFAPDLADLDSQVSPNILNVVPGANSYRPIPGRSAFTDTLAADPKGLWLAKTNSGDFQAFAATASNICELSGTRIIAKPSAKRILDIAWMTGEDRKR